MIKSIEERLRDYKTDYLDIWRPVGATWGKGQKNIPTMLMVSHRALDMVVEVFEKAHKQGKVRWLAIGGVHNPWPGLSDKVSVASILIYLEAWATAQTGQVVELTHFSPLSLFEDNRSQ
jgi:hypothetical protein